MQIVTKENTWPDTWMEFTGAELKEFYASSQEYFICNAICWAFWRHTGAVRYAESESVILALRQAVPNRFKKCKSADIRIKNVVGGWLLQKYKSGNERRDLIRAIPDEHVFTIPMYVERRN